MSLQDDVLQALKSAGKELKQDLWHVEDEPFLAARAKDLMGLAMKAEAAKDPNLRVAYVAAARDVVHHVKLLAMMRMEVGASHVVEALGKFFLNTLVPILIKCLPALLGI
ncbi:MAG TPA: hypothetical protein VIV60_19790 [Polyangiaceae bacterium]